MEQLDDGSIGAATQSDETLIVLFYADWCPFCRKFKPVFEARATVLKARLAEAKINEDGNPMWEKFGIEYVPTMIAFRNGKIVARRDAVPQAGLKEQDLDGIIEEAV